MHDIDRTQREFELAMHELQPEHLEYPGEQEMYGESYGEMYGETGEYGSHETGYETEQYETAGEGYEAESYESGLYEGEFHEYGHESPLHESEEMELAAEFLEITNEAELDRFLGKLVKRAWRGIRRVAPGLLRRVGGFLKPLAKAALPIAGKALGTFVGGPLGGVVGGKLASAAGNFFGLELEGMSGEDREFEVARRFVRFASTAAHNAATVGPGVSPAAAARSGVIGAARQLAPGYLRRRPISAPGAYPQPSAGSSNGEPIPAGSRRRGMWIRRGRRIILLGA